MTENLGPDQLRALLTYIYQMLVQDTVCIQCRQPESLQLKLADPVLGGHPSSGRPAPGTFVTGGPFWSAGMSPPATKSLEFFRAACTHCHHHIEISLTEVMAWEKAGRPDLSTPLEPIPCTRCDTPVLQRRVQSLEPLCPTCRSAEQTLGPIVTVRRKKQVLA